MKISVVLATYNRKNLLDKTISEYLSQDYDNKEIIVVDNASSDGTREMVMAKYPSDKYPEFKYIYLPENIDIRAVNIGIAISTGDIIWRTDDDAYLRDKDSLKKVAEIMKLNPEIGVICVALMNIDASINKDEFVKWYPTSIDYDNVPENGYKAHVFSGAGAALRKEVLNRIGYFWEFGYEELELCTRTVVAGYQVRYFPNLVILHYGANFSGIFNYRYWHRTATQFLRYQAKYFPLASSIIRIFIVFFYSVLLAIRSKYSLSQIMYGIKSMYKTTIKTLMYERDSVEYKQVNDITLGESLAKGYNKRLIGLVKKRIFNGNK
jgi:GT2 family glycosyltransferase